MPTGTRREVVALSVKLEVLTTDKLKKFVFGLTKSKEGDIDKWAMDFSMFDRAAVADPFVLAFDLDIALDLKKVPVEALEATATKGLNKAQIDFTRTTIAADAEKRKAGKIKEDRMKRTAAGVIEARDA